MRWRFSILVAALFTCGIMFTACDLDGASGEDSSAGGDAKVTPEDSTPPPEDTVAPPEDTVAPPEDTVQPPEDTLPPPEDTLPPPEDTLPPPEDTLPPPEDTLPPPEDTLPPPEDTLPPPEDTLPPPEDTVDTGLQWYSTCGNPVCGVGDQPPPGTPPCEKEEAEGDMCFDEGAACDAGLGCGSFLICAGSDPKEFGCPISKRDAKRDIRYLTPQDLGRFTRELLNLRLATWSYKTDAAAQPARLGFIIEDHPESVAVNGAQERVDLYGYTSLVIAAVQQQSKEIEALRAKVEALESKLEACAR